MRGTKDVIIYWGKTPEKPPENVVVFVMVTCRHHVKTVASTEPAPNPLLVICGIGRHVSCARVRSIGTRRYNAGLVQANNGYTLARHRLPDALPADKNALSRHIWCGHVDWVINEITPFDLAKVTLHLMTPEIQDGRHLEGQY